jgi:hypothetical protein
LIGDSRAVPRRTDDHVTSSAALPDTTICNWSTPGRPPSGSGDVAARADQPADGADGRRPGREDEQGGAPARRGRHAGEQLDEGTQENRETERAVGVGPQVDAVGRCERAEFLLPGALRSLRTDVARAEAQLRAIGGVDSAEVTSVPNGRWSPTTRCWSTSIGSPRRS